MPDFISILFKDCPEVPKMKFSTVFDTVEIGGKDFKPIVVCDEKNFVKTGSRSRTTNSRNCGQL